MRQSTYLTAVVALLVPLSLVRAGASLPAPAVRPTTPASLFDLAIVGGDAKLLPIAQVGVDRVTATYSVTLKNLGITTITQENAGCKLGSIEFSRAPSTLTLARNQQGTVTLTTTSPWASIPTGAQAIECVAGIAAPPNARDANGSNNTWSGRVTARTLPELQVTSANLRDCSGGAATTGNTVCVGLEYANVGGPLSQQAFVQCSVTRIQSGATWKLGLVNIGTPAPNTTGKATPIVGNDFSARLPTGHYRTTCTVDPAKSITESNETNNERVATSEVTLPEYDVATAGVTADGGTCNVVSGQNTFTKPYLVTVRNDGTQDLTGVAVSCKFPNRGVGEGTGTYTSVLAPKAKPAVPVCFVPPSRPSEQLYCKATITGPAGVKDQHPENDGWLGTTP